MKQNLCVQIIRWITVQSLQAHAGKCIRCSCFIGVLLSIVSSNQQGDNARTSFLLPDAFPANNKIIKISSLLITEKCNAYRKGGDDCNRFLIHWTRNFKGCNNNSTALRKRIVRFKMKKPFFRDKSLICSVNCTQRRRRKKKFKYRSLKTALHKTQRNRNTKLLTIRCSVFKNQYKTVDEQKANNNGVGLMFSVGQFASFLPKGQLFKQTTLKMMKKVSFTKTQEHLKLPLSNMKLIRFYCLTTEINTVETYLYRVFGSCREKTCRDFYTYASKLLQDLRIEVLFQTWKTKVNLPLRLKQRLRWSPVSHYLEHNHRLCLLPLNKIFTRARMLSAQYSYYDMLLLAKYIFDFDSYSYQNANNVLIYKLLKYSNRGLRKPANVQLSVVCANSWLGANNTIQTKRISKICRKCFGLFSFKKLLEEMNRFNLNTVWIPSIILGKWFQDLYNCRSSLYYILTYINFEHESNVSELQKSVYPFTINIKEKVLCVNCTLIKCHFRCATLNMLRNVDLLFLHIRKIEAALRVNIESKIIRCNILSAVRHHFIKAHLTHIDELDVICQHDRLCGQTSIVRFDTTKIRKFLRRHISATFCIKVSEETTARLICVPRAFSINRSEQTGSHRKKNIFLKHRLNACARKRYFSLISTKKITNEDYFISKLMQTLPKQFVIKSYKQVTDVIVKHKTHSRTVSRTGNACHITYTLRNKRSKMCTRKIFNYARKTANKHNIHVEKLLFLSRKPGLFASEFWFSRMSAEASVFINVKLSSWHEKKAFVNLLTSVDQHYDQYYEEIKREFKISMFSNRNSKDKEKQTNGLTENKGTRTYSEKIRQCAVDFVYIILEMSTSIGYSRKYIEYRDDLDNLFNKIIRCTKQSYIEYGGSRHRKSRDKTIQESPDTNSVVVKTFNKLSKNTGIKFRKGASNKASAYSLGPDKFVKIHMLRSNQRHVTKQEEIRNNLVNKQDDSNRIYNARRRFAQPAQYFSKHEKKVVNALLYARNILQTWLKLSYTARKRQQQEQKLLSNHRPKNNQRKFLDVLKQYILINARGLSESNAIRTHQDGQVRRILKKRYKRRSNFDNDSLIKTDLMTDLRSKWLDMKEDINKLQEKVYDAKERISSAEEDLRRLIKRGDMLAQADVKITKNDRLKNAMVRADWNLVKLEFRALQKEILRLQKQTEKKDRYKYRKKGNRKITMSSIQAKRDMIDQAVKNILSLNEQEVDKKNRTQFTDSDNNDDNEYSNFEEADITSELNALSGFSQGGRYYDPNLERVDNILKDFLSRHKRATFKDDLQKSSDAALLAVKNLNRDGDESEAFTNKMTPDNSRLISHYTPSHKLVSTGSIDLPNATVKFPYFESLEANESFVFLYPKSKKKAFVKEWTKLKKNTTTLLNILIKMKQTYSHIQSGIRRLKVKGKSIEIKINDILKSNETAHMIFNSKKWKRIWKDIKVLQKEIQQYNVQFERNENNRLLQNIIEKTELIQTKLDAEKSHIENKLYSGSNPQTLLPFSIESGQYLQPKRFNIKIHREDENMYDTDSDTGKKKDISPNIMLKKLENLIEYHASSNGNLTSLETTLNKLIMKHATENVSDVNPVNDVNLRRKRGLRVKRRGSSRRRKKKRRRNRGRYSGYPDDDTSSNAYFSDTENPDFIFNVQGKPNYNDDNNAGKPLEEISVSSLYNEDYIGEQAAQELLGNIDAHSVETFKPSNRFRKISPGDGMEYLMPISEHTHDDENSVSDTGPTSNLSTANYYSQSKEAEDKKQEDNLIASKMKDLLNEIDSNNIAESIQGGHDAVTKRDTRNSFPFSVNQMIESKRANGGSYKNIETFRHEHRREELSQQKNPDVVYTLGDVADGFQIESESTLPLLSDIIRHNKIKSFDPNLSKSATIMNSPDYEEAEITSTETPSQINVNKNLEQHRQRNAELTTEMREFKNAQNMETEAVKDFQTFEARLMKKNLKDNSEFLKELKQAINTQDDKDAKVNKVENKIKQRISVKAKHPSKQRKG